MVQIASVALYSGWFERNVSRFIDSEHPGLITELFHAIQPLHDSLAELPKYAGPAKSSQVRVQVVCA